MDQALARAGYDRAITTPAVNRTNTGTSPEQDLAFAGAARQAELLRAREVGARDLVSLYLERIERIDRDLSAFRVTMGEQALAEADRAQARLDAGETGPLLGVPVAIKDEFDVAGQLNTLGTGTQDEAAEADAEVVRRLRAAGAIPIGITKVPELTIWPFTETETWGKTRNPWNPDRVPGGSSGGSGAAVAAGLAPVALGSDGAGSIRIPAAWCGIFGLKVQRGRISYMPLAEHWHGMSVPGPLARHVLDAALFLDAVAGPAPGDVTAPPAPAESFADAARRTPRPLRIAMSTKVPPMATARVSAESRRAVEETADLLRSLGHDVRRHEPSFGMTGNNFVARYMGGVRDDVLAVPHPDRMEGRTRGFGRLGRLYAGGMARRATRAAAADADKINGSWSAFDVLVTPTVGETAVEVGRWGGKGTTRTLLGISRTFCFTPIWNHTGQPAMALPAGYTARGMPRSVTLIGRPADESTLISLAAQMEAERPWTDRRPAVS